MYVSKRIDSWLDRDYLIKISDEIINLEDYVPKLIELHLPNYDKRKEKVTGMNNLIYSDEFQLNQVIDQMAAGTTWDEHVALYDEFFEKHPEFFKLIKDKKAYDNWHLEEPPF